MIKQILWHGELHGWQAAENPCAFTGRRVDRGTVSYEMLTGITMQRAAQHFITLKMEQYELWASKLT